MGKSGNTNGLVSWYYSTSERSVVVRNGIDGRDMGDRFPLSGRIEGDLAGDQALAALHHLRLGQQVARGRPTQEIDGERGGDRTRLRADHRKYRDIHREIGKFHHGRAGDRTARPQMAVAKGTPHAHLAISDMLDRQSATGMEYLR